MGSAIQATLLPVRKAVRRTVPGASGQLAPPNATLSLLTASLLIALVVVRLVDFLGPLTRLRPALMLTAGGILLLWAKADQGARTSLWGNRVFLASAAYLGWALATVPTALWRGQAYDAVRGLAIGVIVLAGVLLLPPSERVVKTLAAAFVLACVLYVALLLTTGEEIVSGRYQVGATLDSNDAGAMFAVAACLALGLSRRSRAGFFRLFWPGLTGVVALGVAFTGSRGGSLALLAGMAVYLAGLKGGTRVGYVVLALAGGLLVWQAAPDSYRERMLALFSGEKDYNYTEYTGRTQIWKRGAIYWSRNPVFGVGVGNFPTAEGEYLKEQGITGKWSAPHNTYVQAFAELGTPGGLLLLAMLLLAGRTALALWRPRGPFPPQPEYLSALAAFAVGAYFLSHAYSYVLFAVVGLIVQAGRARLLATHAAVLPQRKAEGLPRTRAWRTDRWDPGRHAGPPHPR